MKRYSSSNVFLMISLIVLFVSGCSLWGSDKEQSAAIDPPPEQMNVIADQWMDLDDEQITSEANVTTMAVTVYVKDPDGYVVPMTVEVPSVEGIAKETLKYMVKGGPVESQLPTNFHPLLPEGTEVLGMDIKANKLAIVDFSESFSQYDDDDERKVIESVVWTLTSFDTIDQVQIWVNGRALKEMPIRKTPLSETLNRSIGINIEHTGSVPINRSTPVTVYFQKSNEQLSSYFVPVTRIVDHTDQIAHASVEQLLIGPSFMTTLSPVIEPVAQVTNVDLTDDLVTVYFSNTLLEHYEQVPASFLQSVVLSLTENTGARQVRIFVDGHNQVISTDDVNYSEPITRPAFINKSNRSNEIQHL